MDNDGNNPADVMARALKDAGHEVDEAAMADMRVHAAAVVPGPGHNRPPGVVDPEPPMDGDGDDGDPLAALLGALAEVGRDCGGASGDLALAALALGGLDETEEWHGLEEDDDAFERLERLDGRIRRAADAVAVATDRLRLAALSLLSANVAALGLAVERSEGAAAEDGQDEEDAA